MAKLFGMRFNWKVLLALGAAGVGIWILAPTFLLAALPLLLLAACPLSMLVMGWGMKRWMEGTHHDSPASQEPAQVDAQVRLAALEAKQAALPLEIAQVRSEIEQRQKVSHAPKEASRG